MSSPAPPNGLCERWNAVRARLESAAARAGRPPPRLVAVTKSVDAAQAAGLAALGQLDLGESRVQALAEKAAALARQGLAPRWHLVGHLQRNKARRAVGAAHAIHSLDSLALAEALERLCAELGAEPELYVEVDYVRDGARTGLAEERVQGFVDSLRALPHLRLAGLMTIAPVPPRPGDASAARAVFARLRELSERLPKDAFVHGRPLLSMGMSGDFEVAAEEGSDCVRVGSALFEAEESRP